jgi:hypothetical protein
MSAQKTDPESERHRCERRKTYDERRGAYDEHR